MIGHGIIFSGSEDIKHPPVGFFDGAKLHKGHFALSLPSFEAAPCAARNCMNRAYICAARNWSVRECTLHGSN